MIIALLQQIGMLLLLATACVIVWTTATVAACVILRIKMEKISIFFGKPIFSFTTPLCRVHIGCIPAGGYVARDLDEFSTHSLLARWLVIASGPIAVVVSAMACLGVPETFNQMSTALGQLAGSALHPRTSGLYLVGRFFDMAIHAPTTGYGIFAAKSSTLYILPIPSLPLGSMIIQLLPKREKSRFLNGFQTYAAILLLVFFCSWIWVLLLHFWQLR